MTEKLSQRSQNITVEEKGALPQLMVVSPLPGWKVVDSDADSSEVVKKAIKIKQTLHYSVLLSEFSKSLPFKFFSSELSFSFFFSFLSGMEFVIKYSSIYCRGLNFLN